MITSQGFHEGTRHLKTSWTWAKRLKVCPNEATSSFKAVPSCRKFQKNSRPFLTCRALGNRPVFLNGPVYVFRWRQKHHGCSLGSFPSSGQLVENHGHSLGNFLAGSTLGGPIRARPAETKFGGLDMSQDGFPAPQETGSSPNQWSGCPCTHEKQGSRLGFNNWGPWNQRRSKPLLSRAPFEAHHQMVFLGPTNAGWEAHTADRSITCRLMGGIPKVRSKFQVPEALFVL